MSFLDQLMKAIEAKNDHTKFDNFKEELRALARKHKVTYAGVFFDNETGCNESNYEQAQKNLQEFTFDSEADFASTITFAAEKLTKSAHGLSMLAGTLSQKERQKIKERTEDEGDEEDDDEGEDADGEPSNEEPARVEKAVYDKDGKQIGDYEVAEDEKKQTVLPILKDRTGLISPYSIASSVVLYLDRAPYQFHGVCDVAFGIGAKFKQIGWPLGELTKKKLIVKEGHGKFARIRLATTEDYAEAEESTVS